MVLPGRLGGRVGRRQVIDPKGQEALEVLMYLLYIKTLIPAWLLGQVVKTPPFHGGNRGSSPLGVSFVLFFVEHMC